MLQTIRDHTQGWIAGTIISIIILTFALWGIHSYFVGGGSSNIIAEVNGVEITREQLSLAYERLRKQVQMQYGANVATPANDNVLKDRALKGLIDVEALKQASYRQGFRISDVQIDNYLQSIPDFQVQGQFSFERFQEILSSAYLSTSEFLDLLRTSMLIDQPKLGILMTAFALPNETNYAIALVNQERDINYLILPNETFLTQVNITPEQINAYYTAHREEFKMPEQVSVDYIELSLPAIAAKIEPPEEALKSFYQENLPMFAEPKKWQLQDIIIPVVLNATPEDQQKAEKLAQAEYETLKKDGDFANAAKQYSSTLNGTTWMSLNQLPSDYKKSVATLVKPGDVAAPVRTEKGWVIIKAVDVKEPRSLSYEEAKDKVKIVYVRQQAEEQFAQARERLADLAYEHPDSLQHAAETLNLPIKTSEKFSLESASSEGLLASRKVRTAAFSNDVLSLQNNSDVIQVNPELAVVIHAKTHTQAVQLPLAEVEKQIVEKLKQKEAETQAIKVAEQIVAGLRSSKDINPILQNLKVEWKKSGYLGRYSDQIESAILDTAFRLPDPAKTAGKPSYGIAKIQNGYAVVVLNSVKKGTADAKQAQIFAEQTQTSEGMLEYELYKTLQLSEAKITKG